MKGFICRNFLKSVRPLFSPLQPRFEGNNSRLASLILANTELVKIKEVATFVFVNLDTGENIAMKV